MANAITSQGNLAFFKTQIDSFIGLGEKRIGSEFYMTIDSYPDLTYLVQSAQIPQMQRQIVELVTNFGISSRQIGVPDIGHEMSVSFLETVGGHAMEALHKWFTSKSKETVVLKLVGENDLGTSSSIPEGVAGINKFTLRDCVFNMEATEVGVEENTTALKLSGNLIYSYCEEFFVDSK